MSDLPMIAPGYETEGPQYEDVSGCLTNRCVIDKQTLTEAMHAALNTPFFRRLRIAELCLMVLSLGLLIWSIVGGLGLMPAIWSGFALLMLAYFFWQQFLRYPKNAVRNQLTRQARDDGSAALENWLYFQEENIANRRGEAEELLHMPYTKIRLLLETRRLYVLKTKSKNLIPLDKSGFTNGTGDDFRKLLARKCPRALSGK